MYKKTSAIITLLTILATYFITLSPLHAAIATRSKSFKTSAEAENYLNTHFNNGCALYNEKKWKDAAGEFERVVFFCSNQPLAAQAYFYLGVCFFEMKEYDFANTAFSNYLKACEQPEFFEQVIYYKFWIAEYFKSGGKKHYLGLRYCPKWGCGKEMAITIYDEIITTVPNHNLAVASLFSKANLQHSQQEYRDTIETYQTLIRRFPKNELTPQAYLNIAKTYCELSRLEFQNPDLLALAELNVRKFKEDFPRDERVETAEGYVQRIKENYAKGLCDIGRFYERTKNPNSAAIYYQSSVEEFPETDISSYCRYRLNNIELDEELRETIEMISSTPPEQNVDAVTLDLEPTTNSENMDADLPTQESEEDSGEPLP